jgi:hypothetical protein
MSASSDAFFGPRERWEQFRASSLWADEDRARDLLEESLGAIKMLSPERQDLLFRLLHRQLETSEDMAERLTRQQTADEPLNN